MELICQRSETARTTYELTQQFMTMLRLRRGQGFEAWLAAVCPQLVHGQGGRSGGLDALLQQGPVEAQVHTLKLVKRSMYGRAKLPLLRQRLLHVA